MFAVESEGGDIVGRNVDTDPEGLLLDKPRGLREQKPCGDSLPAVRGGGVDPLQLVVAAEAACSMTGDEAGDEAEGYGRGCLGFSSF